jgi:hypothetical protein
MATVTRGLPERPHLDRPKREARALLDGWKTGSADDFQRIRNNHPRFGKADDAHIASASFRLADAQLIIAREYGFTNWTQLKLRIETNAATLALDAAIRAGDRESVVHIIRSQPDLLHVPVVSGNWGPPMSHAANMNRLDIVMTLASLGARDFQHAFDRAVLHGNVDCARWLLANGAALTPGVIMGSCETLNAAGFDFLVDLGAPIANAGGDRLAPLAMVLETYARNPDGKHEILASMHRRGYELPDSPMMALHCGDITRLEEHVQRDPSLLSRRFALRGVYPTELGCSPDGRSGMHWTPIDGTTMLHLAIDFDEYEIFEWLLARGADIDARAVIDADGFGGHTPLFHTVVSHPSRDTRFIRALLGHGARTDVRASLRKFLDWCEVPRLHVARAVSAAEWARDFPERHWVNRAALALLD